MALAIFPEKIPTTPFTSLLLPCQKQRFPKKQKKDKRDKKKKVMERKVMGVGKVKR